MDATTVDTLPFVIWLCMCIAIRIAAHPASCDNPGCSAAHRVHRDRERRAEVAHHHGWHRNPHPLCERCDRGEPRE